jgi:hypothetical protein
LSLSLWPNHILTQFLTNYGRFRSYLHRMKTAPTPLCNCPEKAEQTAQHLMTDCSLFSRDRPATLRNLALPLLLKYHINTVGIPSLLTNIHHLLQEQAKFDQIL